MRSPINSILRPRQYGKRSKIDPVCSGLAEIERSWRIQTSLETTILELLPRLITELRVTPIDAPILELELVAHGDGAFFTRHVDTIGNDPDQKRIRVLSGVYYFNAEPKAFTGGALRLHAIGGGEDENFIDIEPVHNSLAGISFWRRTKSCRLVVHRNGLSTRALRLIAGSGL